MASSDPIRKHLDPLNLVVDPAHFSPFWTLFWPFKGPFESSMIFFGLFGVSLYVASSGPMRNHLDPLNLVVDPAHVWKKNTYFSPFWPFKGPFGSSSTNFWLILGRSSYGQFRYHVDPLNL